MKHKIKTKGRARIFQNPVLEALTLSSPIESSITSVAISAMCIWAGFALSHGFTVFWAGAVFLIGLLSWTFFEYVLHRYLFHVSPGTFPGSGRLAYLLHGIHHEYPNDAKRTLMPFVPKVIFSVLLFGIFYLIMGIGGHFSHPDF